MPSSRDTGRGGSLAQVLALGSALDATFILKIISRFSHCPRPRRFVHQYGGFLVSGGSVTATEFEKRMISRQKENYTDC